MSRWRTDTFRDIHCRVPGESAAEGQTLSRTYAACQLMKARTKDRYFPRHILQGTRWGCGRRTDTFHNIHCTSADEGEGEGPLLSVTHTAGHPVRVQKNDWCLSGKSRLSPLPLLPLIPSLPATFPSETFDWVSADTLWTHLIWWRLVSFLLTVIFGKCNEK